MNINKLKKIGVSALAGSLVSFAATAADWSVSGSAGITIDKTDDTKTTTYNQADSVTITASGETDNGISVSALFELDGDNHQGSWDSHNFKVGTAELGTLTFYGDGGSSIMSQFDDISPKAYEEISDVTTGADNVIGGQGGSNMFEYTSPSFSGLTVKAAMNTTSSDSGNFNKYSDMGVTFSPEMVEGLTLYYATGTNEASQGVDTDLSTMAVKYAFGPVTVSYQESEADVGSSTTDRETEHMAIAYTVSDNLSVSYGVRDYDLDTSAEADGSMTQEDKGLGIAYTAGGVGIKLQMNDSENTGGNTEAANDVDSTSIAVSFAF